MSELNETKFKKIYSKNNVDAVKKIKNTFLKIKTLLFKLLVAYANNVRPNNLKQEQKMKNKIRKIVEFTLV